MMYSSAIFKVTIKKLQRIFSLFQFLLLYYDPDINFSPFFMFIVRK